MPNTLAARLFILSSIMALIGIGIVAFVITADFRRNAEEQLGEVLVANVFNLMGTVEVDNKGQLMGFPELGDARYSLFDSGWYWSVEKVGSESERISSSSLVRRSITVPDDAEFDATFQRFFETEDQTGKLLLGLEAKVFLGEGDDLYSFRITANKNSIDQEIASFRNRIALILSVFALSIVMATYLAVKFSLRPISTATEMLGEIRAGNAKRIEGEYPDEIQPLITETNALISSNNTIVERARTQVGNLAHSLKTPLAVMQNEVLMIKGERRKLFEEQMQTMRQQVQVYLDRSRISARTSTSIANSPVIPTLEKLTQVISKLNPRIDMGFDYDDDINLIFEGEEHDLQEIFGNLIENACKYATMQVLVNAALVDDKLEITVEDDGSGMSEQDIEMAKKRGGRIDEGKTGWGLGLSIVHDIVDEYEGEFELGKSELGGLHAKIILPGHAAT